MGYGESLLGPGERIVRRVTRHPLLIVRRSGWAVLATLAAVALLVLRATVDGSTPVMGLLGYVTFLLAVYAVVAIGWSALTFATDELLVTSRRVVRARGVFGKRTIDAALDHVLDAVLAQSALGRLLDYGDLDVRTTGGPGLGRLAMVREPKAIKQAMLEARHELELERQRPTMPAIRMGPDGRPVRTAGEPQLRADAVIAELRRLAERHEAGEITREAFERRKGELLARL